MLRHPVDRAYSNYGFCVQRWNFRGSFEDFLAARPRMLERGFYSRYIKRFLRYFDRNQLLALIFEEVVVNIPLARQTLADFLEIDVDKFPPSAGSKKVNSSTISTYRSLYGFTTRVAQRLKKWQLHAIVDLGKRIGIPQVLAKGKPLPPLDRESRQRLSRLYQDEFHELEHCLQIDLSCWRHEMAHHAHKGMDRGGADKRRNSEQVGRETGYTR